MVLKVFRWSPGFPERLQRFWVPAKEGMTVLDALVDAQRRLDPTLAFRYACRVGMCGSCAMVVNGRERWACRTLLKSLKSGIVTVRPLYHFPLVRDLVVDMAPLVEQTARVGGVFVPADGPPTAARIGRDSAERQVGPLRELVGEEPMHERLVDLKLVGVHPRRHAYTQSDDVSLACASVQGIARHRIGFEVLGSERR